MNLKFHWLFEKVHPVPSWRQEVFGGQQTRVSTHDRWSQLGRASTQALHVNDQVCKSEICFLQLLTRQLYEHLNPIFIRKCVR